MKIEKIVVEGIFKIGTIALKTLIKNSINSEGTGFDILKEETDGTADIISDIATTKIYEYFFQSKTTIQKLNAILKEEFDELNEKIYDGKFGGCLEYLNNTNNLLDSEEDIKKSISEWNQNERTSVSTLSSREINEFVTVYFENVRTRIREDTVLNQYLKVLQTSKTVDNIIEEIYKIQDTMKDLATKENLKKMLEEIKISHPRETNNIANNFYQDNLTKTVKDDSHFYRTQYEAPYTLHQFEPDDITAPCLKNCYIKEDCYYFQYNSDNPNIPNHIEDTLNKEPLLSYFKKFLLRNTKSKLLLILGHGGTGKTSFVSYVTCNQEEICINRKIYVIRLREYTKESPNSLCDKIQENIRYPEKIENNAILIFDGLDELCMMKKWKSESISTKIIRKLYEVFGSGTERKIIITSRNAYVSTDNVYKAMEGSITRFMSVAFIAKLDKEKIIEFAKCLKEKDFSIQKDCDWVIEHIEQIEKNKNADIYSSPYLLYLICSASKDDDGVDVVKKYRENDWLLFRKVFYKEYIHKEYDLKTNSLTRILRENSEDLCRITRNVAYKMLHDRSFVITQSDIDMMIDREDVGEEIKTKIKHCYPLSCCYNRHAKNASYEFYHNHVRDFFICEYILDNINQLLATNSLEKSLEVIADFFSSSLQYMSFQKIDSFSSGKKDSLILYFIEEYCKSETSIYSNIKKIDKDNVHQIFRRFFKTGGLVTYQYIDDLDIQTAVNNVIRNTRDIIDIFLPNLSEEYVEKEEGDVFQYGIYRWKILKKYDDSILAISEDIVDVRPYHEKWEEITWEDCTLRKWLNQEFYEAAFNEYEKEQISKVHIKIENPDKINSTESYVIDKVFLLSSEDLKDEKISEIILNEKNLNSELWWLRSPGNIGFCASIIDDGKISESGFDVHNILGVRPVLKFMF